jgi:predicted RNA-binding Zn ribbon-like protein
MSMPLSDDDFLLGILNSTPVTDGTPTDDFADTARACAWLAGAGGLGTADELRQVLEARRLLQAVVRGEQPPQALGAILRDAVRVPVVTGGQVSWELRVAPERELAIRAVLIWDSLTRNAPGRLRPCANDECRLFLIDRSKAGTARWCSMAVCGNRMKARRHYTRTRAERPAGA